MGFSTKVNEAATQVLRESYADGIDLGDWHELKNFRRKLCQITGENPDSDYSTGTIRELLKVNGRTAANKIVPYSAPVSVFDFEKARPNRRNAAADATPLSNELEKYRGEYRPWFVNHYGAGFEDYWKLTREVVDDAQKFRIVDASLNGRALKKIRDELFLLPERQVGVFPARWKYQNALNRFILFWNELLPFDAVRDDEKSDSLSNGDAIETTDERIENGRFDRGRRTSKNGRWFFEDYKDGYFRWRQDRGGSSMDCFREWRALTKIVKDASENGVIGGSLSGDVLCAVVEDFLTRPEDETVDSSLQKRRLSALRNFLKYWIEKFPRASVNNIDELDSYLSDGDAGSEEGTPPDEQETSDEQPDENRHMESVSSDNYESIESYKDDFIQWLRKRGLSSGTCSAYWASFRRIVNEAIERDIIPSAFEIDDLERIETELFSLREYQADVFPSRNNCLNALKYFIQFWNDDSVDESSDQSYQAGKDRSYQTDKRDYNAISKTTRIANAIREHFPSGFRFDDSNLSLLTSAMGERLDSLSIADVKERMFGRKDGVFFFSNFVIDRESEDALFEQVNKFADLNSGFEAGFLYEKYRDRLNSICVRNDGDFEDWLVKMSPVELRFTSVGKFRIARLKTIRNDEEFTDALLQKIRDAANANYGTIEENDIVDTFDGFSLDCLSHIVKFRADDVFVKKINETICFQTFEGLGIPDDFSSSIQKAIDKVDKYGLAPSLDVLTAMLAAEAGYNPREEYGITEDKAFRKLIEVCYQGDVPRKWKANVFGKDE